MLPTEYIEVALPVPIQGTFTYHVPEDMRRNLTIGSRVVVTFGRRRNFYTGIVAAYRYRFALYNLYENPGIGVMEALDMSKRQTLGYKSQLFTLD